MRRIPVIQLGVGNVGQSLIEQVAASRVRHADLFDLRLDHVALVDSDGAIVNPKGFSDDSLSNIAQAKAGGSQLNELSNGHVQCDPAAIVDVAGADEAIVIDVTASQETIPALLESLGRGYRVVTANKLPLTESYALFQTLTSSRQLRFETTVGAGLPVLSTLQSLVDVDDRVQRIQGSLSGTLGFICSQLDAGKRFSEAVREAEHRGYTEPDPREDLAGSDVARKALIMARMLDNPAEFEDVEVQSLYPREMDDLTINEFLAEVDALDEEYDELANEARASGKRLRYISEVVDGHCRVCLAAVDPDNRLAHLQGSDSMVVFETGHYRDNPLVISGPGAGPTVTAAGVLRDIVGLAL
ncbi:MAG: Bifunctional aspartokinase/homoserine dehydrogenase 1 [Anaerolineales bacterium]|nr:Bifunctional aspartokinase/homoserine dehydrogenase 1 [Anaerolineales bacterium]